MADFLEFFALKEDPFRITPDVDFFFMSSVHQEALSSLEYLVETGEGFAVIVGEPGTGKTITIRKFITQMPENIEYAYILFPNLSPEELFMAVLEDFGITVSEKVSKNKLFSILKDFLVKKKQEGKKVLIIIDEAQNLPVETLEELRILSNLETEKEKLLQIILLGQPELERKINSEELRQLKQRITIYCRLKNLDKKEMVDYINYRLAKAGNSTIKISNKAYNLIYKYSQGNLRLINLIMERSLMSAFVENRYSVESSDVENAAQSLGITHKKSYSTYIIFMLFIFSVVLAGGYGYYIYSGKEKTQVNTTEYATVSVERLNMRENPSKDSKIVYVLKKGDRLEVLKRKGEWSMVRFKNMKGWVNNRFLR